MKRTITAITLATVLTLGTTFANAGIIVAGSAEKNDTGKQCTDTRKDGIIVAGRDGIIVAGLTGIIVAGLTGIIVAGAEETTPSDCGTTVDRDGIIVAG